MTGEHDGSALRRLSAEARNALIGALETERLTAPFTELGLRRFVGAATSAPLAKELERLVGLGLTAPLLREVLRLLEPRSAPAPSLVWSGPEEPGAETRDTGVVLRELFDSAERRVLVAGYALYQGRQIFEVLARRMDEDPHLRVELFLDVGREWNDTTESAELLYAFASRFRSEQWPGRRLPVVYYDPRSLEPTEPGKKRASLHAKCVVVDDVRVFVTSANLTEAAQERNIEVGVRLDDGALAASLVGQFERLVSRGALSSLPGL